VEAGHAVGGGGGHEGRRRLLAGVIGGRRRRVVLRSAAAGGQRSAAGGGHAVGAAAVVMRFRAAVGVRWSDGFVPKGYERECKSHSTGGVGPGRNVAAFDDPSDAAMEETTR